MKRNLKLTSIAASILFAACSTSEKESKINQEKFQVINPVVMDTVYHSDYVCDIHAVKNVEVRARVKGYIENIHVDEGKPVKKGQLLFSISKQEFKEKLFRARAELKSAIAEAKAAELDLKNAKTLSEKNIISKTEVEMAKSKLEALNAKVDMARSEEVKANLELSFTDVRAPFDGVVDRIPNKAGSLIDEGTLLTTISDNSEVFAYFNVSENEYLEHVAGVKESPRSNTVSLILANNSVYPVKGRIETIEGEFDNVTGSIAFRARFSNPDKILRHGASGKVRLMNPVDDALVIPQKSTFEIQNMTYVYVLDENNKVQMRNITPKLRLPHLYVLEDGLTTGDKVIYEGTQNVQVGMQVQPELVSLRKIVSQLAML